MADQKQDTTSAEEKERVEVFDKWLKEGEVPPEMDEPPSPGILMTDKDAMRIVNEIRADQELVRKLFEGKGGPERREKVREINDRVMRHLGDLYNAYYQRLVNLIKKRGPYLRRAGGESTAMDIAHDTIIDIPKSLMNADDKAKITGVPFKIKHTVWSWITGIARNKLAEYTKLIMNIEVSSNIGGELEDLLSKSLSELEFSGCIHRDNPESILGDWGVVKDRKSMSEEINKTIVDVLVRSLMKLTERQRQAFIVHELMPDRKAREVASTVPGRPKGLSDQQWNDMLVKELTTVERNYADYNLKRTAERMGVSVSAVSSLLRNGMEVLWPAMKEEFDRCTLKDESKIPPHLSSCDCRKKDCPECSMYDAKAPWKNTPSLVIFLNKTIGDIRNAMQNNEFRHFILERTGSEGDVRQGQTSKSPTPYSVFLKRKNEKIFKSMIPGGLEPYVPKVRDMGLSLLALGALDPSKVKPGYTHPAYQYLKLRESVGGTKEASVIPVVDTDIKVASGEDILPKVKMERVEMYRAPSPEKVRGSKEQEAVEEKSTAQILKEMRKEHGTGGVKFTQQPIISESTRKGKEAVQEAVQKYGPYTAQRGCGRSVPSREMMQAYPEARRIVNEKIVDLMVKNLPDLGVDEKGKKVIKFEMVPMAQLRKSLSIEPSLFDRAICEFAMNNYYKVTTTEAVSYEKVAVEGKGDISKYGTQKRVAVGAIDPEEAKLAVPNGRGGYFTAIGIRHMLPQIGKTEKGFVSGVDPSQQSTFKGPTSEASVWADYVPEGETVIRHEKASK